MIKKYLLGLMFFLYSFENVLSATYYVKEGETDSTDCTSPTESLCGSFEYVMSPTLPFPKIIYIQSGSYSYTTSQYIDSSNEYFHINGAIDDGVNIGEVSTYPIITFSSEVSYSYSIRFYTPGYFRCLKILWGNTAYSNAFLFRGFIFTN
jgi:hypothetical protein